MKVIISCVGKMRSGAEQSLMQEYLTRLPWQVSVKEVEEKRKLSGDALKDAEGALLLQAVPHGAACIVLDECGKQCTSREFAAMLEGYAQSHGAVCFMIGGADGHGEVVKNRANALFSFGKLTYPHMLVRAMLAEQLYRAWTIQQRHPYHRD